MSIFKSREPAPYSESAPYQKANGRWYVLVTIDNATEIEQAITPPADAVPDEVDQAPKRKPGRPPKAK